jgi:hypothetical protein
MTTIGVNNFVYRQSPESRFSHYTGTWGDLVALAEKNFVRAVPGYKDGVLMVPVDPSGFFSGVVKVKMDTALKASFEARRKGEESFVSVEAVGGEKLPAVVVDLVLYRHDVLGIEATTAGEWEIVSINARPHAEPEPLTPVAMARNMLGLPGGTQATYSARQFAESVIYWSTHVMAG